MPVISHGAAFFLTVIINSRFQYETEGTGFGCPGITTTRVSIIPLWPGYTGNHLNRIHFEIVLNSVCCVNPSLDVYFNSADIASYTIYRQIDKAELPISKINIKSVHQEQSEKKRENKR